MHPFHYQTVWTENLSPAWNEAHVDDLRPAWPRAGVSWRYYHPDAARTAFLQQFSPYKRDAAKVVPIANWSTDVKNDTILPAVIFIERAGTSGRAEHPGANVQVGAADGAGIINALIGSPSWAASAFILTYDEGGALYDHVRPAKEIKPNLIAPMVLFGDKPGDLNQSGSAFR